VLVILAGFVTSGLLINQAFTDWAKNPVITTLDSIAAPINLIQFPTVTVCTEKNSPPDNWAFAETILNVIAFECSTFSFDLPTCGNTTVVREDFKDVYTKLFDLIKKWGNKYKDLKLLESEERFLGTFVRLTAQYISNKEFSIHDLQNTLLKWFNAKETLQGILDKLGDYSDPETALKDACTEKKCKGKLYVVEMFLKAASFLLEFQDKMPFGTYISNFVNISGTTTFDPNKGLEYDNQRCKNIKPMDDLVHGYLTDLAEATGFTNGSFSLYEIPSMLATIDSAAFKNPTIQQAFFYSQCKTTDDWSKDLEFYACSRSWRKFLESHHAEGGIDPKVDEGQNGFRFWIPQSM
jgi:hypothetical protein